MLWSWFRLFSIHFLSSRWVAISILSKLSEKESLIEISFIFLIFYVESSRNPRKRVSWKKNICSIVALSSIICSNTEGASQFVRQSVVDTSVPSQGPNGSRFFSSFLHLISRWRSFFSRNIVEYQNYSIEACAKYRKWRKFLGNLMPRESFRHLSGFATARHMRKFYDRNA